MKSIFFVSQYVEVIRTLERQDSMQVLIGDTGVVTKVDGQLVTVKINPAMRFVPYDRYCIEKEIEFYDKQLKQKSPYIFNKQDENRI
jgi:hypothetical protein